MIQMTIFIIFLFLTTLLVRNRNTSTRKADYIIPDCIDLQIEITPLSFEEMSHTAPGENSATIRERVIRARQMQANRYADCKGVHCNAQMNSQLLRKFAKLDEQSTEMLRTAMTRLQLSARAYDRILKVARTIADLEESENIQTHHLAEAIGYRNLDRDDWAERGT